MVAEQELIQTSFAVRTQVQPRKNAKRKKRTVLQNNSASTEKNAPFPFMEVQYHFFLYCALFFT